MLDAGEGACVYLGLKDGVDQKQMIEDLRRANKGEIEFDAEKYINKFPAKKHDHFLIPAGTCHCSGSEAMVLEISATPYIFTFKLWDWGRVGLDTARDRYMWSMVKRLFSGTVRQNGVRKPCKCNS